MNSNASSPGASRNRRCWSSASCKWVVFDLSLFLFPGQTEWAHVPNQDAEPLWSSAGWRALLHRCRPLKGNQANKYYWVESWHTLWTSLCKPDTHWLYLECHVLALFDEVTLLIGLSESAQSYCRKPRCGGRLLVQKMLLFLPPEKLCQAFQCVKATSHDTLEKYYLRVWSWTILTLVSELSAAPKAAARRAESPNQHHQRWLRGHQTNRTWAEREHSHQRRSLQLTDGGLHRTW